MPSGIATGGQWGYSAPLDSEKFGKNREKAEENQEKEGKNQEKEENLGRFFQFAPPDRQDWLCYW